jgi:hypothetical protein
MIPLDPHARMEYLDDLHEDKVETMPWHEMVEGGCVECEGPADDLVNCLCPTCRCPLCGSPVNQDGLLRDMGKCVDPSCGALLISPDPRKEWEVASYSDAEKCLYPGCLNMVEHLGEYCETCKGDMP